MGKRLERIEKTCKVCGKIFEDIITSKKQYCSAKCSNQSSDRIKKIKETNLEKYGVENVAQFREIKDKIKNRLVEKYGVENISQLSDIKQKKRETCKRNFGVDYALQSSELLRKLKDTNLKNNGSETYNNREKAKQTLKSKYGIENISQAKHIREMFDLKFYESIWDNRLVYNVEPKFSFEEFEGINNRKEYSFICLDCSNEFKTDLSFNKLPRCPICHTHKSKYEQELIKFITNLIPGIKIQTNNRRIISPLELDIYLPEYKLAIEFNGLYWHSEEMGCDKNYHLNKTKKCSEEGVRLIQIFEDEWVGKRHIVEHRLKHILGMSDKRIYARNCEIKEIDSKTKNIFLTETHIQGKDTSSVYYGLFYEDELVSVMTFGVQRGIMGKKSLRTKWELYRFSNKYNVIGAASRLLKKFIGDYSPEQIITYSDRRWNTGNMYEKIGFSKISDGTPNYWYVINGKREYRYNYRKSELKNKLKLFDPNVSESENMKNNGYTRIWDCGHLKYIL